MRAIPVLAALLTLSTAVPLRADEPPAKKDSKKYICPPCTENCHDKTFDQPGRCPVCNMRLKEMDAVRNVAILIWDGVEVLDFTGPAEVFAATRAFGESPFHVYTVAPKSEPIVSQGFIRVTANHTFDNAPSPDIIVIPGGSMKEIAEDEAAMKWIKSSSLQAEITMSVCTGAFVLARLELLDDLDATTWHGAIDRLRTEAPNVKVHRGRRIVDNGDIITTAGVSAGIDGALHIVKNLYGDDIARKTAEYMEYEWIPEFDHGYIDYVRDTGINDRTRPFVAELIEGIETRIIAGRFKATDVLSDPRWMFLHEQPAFRKMLEKQMKSSSATLAPPGEPGEKLTVTGKVTDADGKPVANAKLYVFHTGNDGSYSSKGGNFAASGDSLNPRLFGYLRTGADGNYEFHTIKPAGYPESGPPAHVHYQVSADGHEELVTELMFEGDPRLTSSVRDEMEKAGFVIAPLTKSDNGAVTCVCDLRLEKK